MTADSYWCEHAVVDGQLAHSVAITVADGRILSIDEDNPHRGEYRLDGLTAPGFANAHSHAFHRALRGRTQADRGTFWTWRDLMYAVASRLDPDAYHRLARAVFAEMAVAGVSTVGEFHYVHHQPDGTPYADSNAMGQALLAAAADVGVRITLLDTLYLHGGLDEMGYGEPSPQQLRYSDGDVHSWETRVDSLRAAAATDGQIVGAAIHSVRAVDPTSMRLVAEWARSAEAPLHAHVSEQQAENTQCRSYHGGSPIELLADADVLGPNFTAVHATHVTEEDIDLLSEAQAIVCMCPTTERDLGDGIGPSSAFAEAAIAICLGSDSHAVIDPLNEARAVELDERLRREQRGLHSASELLEMATVNGQKSLGWHDAGTIAVGQRADLTTIALDSVRTAGSSDEVALETAIFAATASDVTNVIIDGAIVATHGEHVRIDAAAELQASIQELVR